MPDKSAPGHAFSDLANMLRREMLKNREAKGLAVPPPDLFDPEMSPLAVVAGDNKFSFAECPSCGKPPTQTQLGPKPVFLFRDRLSVTEYAISGLCQACQDATFKPDGEGD